MLTEQRAASIEEFHSLVENVFYRSEAYLPDGLATPPAFRLESTKAGLLPITRFQGADVAVRREWKHIRNRSCELYVIWFPLKGAVSITQDAAHDSRTGEDEFAITCGDRPFHVRAAAAGAVNTQLHVLVPSHLIRSQFPNIDRVCGRPFSARTGSGRIARDIFGSLVTEASRVSNACAGQLGLAGLEAIADSIKQTVSTKFAYTDPRELHLERVFCYIDQHLSATGLTADRVASACNVSRRYLHYLMRHRGTTFGKYLWDARLKQAHTWLMDQEFRHFNIADIAAMCGFRSASHFSNAYRTQYGCPPRDGRTSLPS